MYEESGISADALKNLCAVFRILSDETRLRIVSQLVPRPMSVGALCKALSLPQHTVSHHLGILWRGGIVYRHRDGKRVIYTVERGVFKVLTRRLVRYFGGEPA